ncbi:hypothetical protein [Leptospira gomenensis]|uniref:hypothetical protein n=1 Tax=Leptospira gomenensis TaxID=2484974 RepID=UPI00143844BA|nr:hypothetical protein [Leptospira gomenensis]
MLNRKPRLIRYLIQSSQADHFRAIHALRLLDTRSRKIIAVVDRALLRCHHPFQLLKSIIHKHASVS